MADPYEVEPTFLILAIVTFGCRDHDAPTITAFTLTSPTDNITFPGNDLWIVIRKDEAGELIDSKLIPSRKTVEFQTNKVRASEKLFVSLIRTDHIDGNDHGATVIAYHG